MITVTLFLATLFLAYSNGANDNFKGVATLFGSRTLSYRGALAWATVTTLAGSAASVYLAEGLLNHPSISEFEPNCSNDLHPKLFREPGG